MSSSVRVLVGLIAGLAAGVLVGAVDAPWLYTAAAVLQPVGDLWLSALQMTVIPLVVSLLITGIASASDTVANGKLAGRAVLLFLVILACSAVFSALVTPRLLAWWPVGADAAASLRAGLGEATASIPKPPAVSEWFKNIVPSNPFRAAAEGAVLPLVMFGLIFGLAASRLEAALRAPLLAFFQAIVATMLVIVQWVLWVAPAGVFALAIGVGQQGGMAAAGAIAHYVVLVSAVAILVTVLAYATAVFFGRIPLLQFARAALPAQVVGFSTQSSLASLPAMLTAAQSSLQISARVAGIVLPLAVSLFRATSPAVNLAVVLFVAHIYGVQLSAPTLTVGVLVATITSLGVVSLPSALTFFTTTVPISMAMGVPLELLSLLIAVEAVPDLFRTVGNVTADLAATTIVAHGDRGH